MSSLSSTTSRNESIREVASRLGAVQKSPRGAPAYTRFVNRRIGGYLAAVAFRLHLTPNQLTVLSFSLSVMSLGLVAFVPSGPALAVVSVLGLLFAFGLDSADGQLARLRGGGSALGEFLDHSLDAAKIYLFHGAVAIALLKNEQAPNLAPLVAFAFQFVAIVMFSSSLLIGFLRKKPSESTPPVHASTLRAFAMTPVDYGVQCLVLLLLPWTAVFVSAYTSLMLITTVFAALVLTHWGRELGRGSDRDRQAIDPPKSSAART